MKEFTSLTEGDKRTLLGRLRDLIDEAMNDETLCHTHNSARGRSVVTHQRLSFRGRMLVAAVVYDDDRASGFDFDASDALDGLTDADRLDYLLATVRSAADTVEASRTRHAVG